MTDKKTVKNPSTTKGRPLTKGEDMTEVPKHIEVMARGICREKCAFMGEPPCFTVMDNSPFTWPPETCCEPGCISEATAARAALVAAGFAVVPRKMSPEMFSAAYDAYYNETGAGLYDAHRAMIEAAEKP
jgi:hypothetical protein